MSKRIYFNTATPNDKGSIIPNESLDFTRFIKNPVLIKNHMSSSDPIGILTDLKCDNTGWSGLPEFHDITEDARTTKEMYNQGFLKSASIGGIAHWQTDNFGNVKLDPNGNQVCSKFEVYEVSIVTIPSNMDAVQLESIYAPKIYNKQEIETFNSKITMSEVKPKEGEASKTDEAKPTELALASTTKDEPGLPKWFKEIIGLGGKMQFGADPAPVNDSEVIKITEPTIGKEPAQDVKLKAKEDAKAEAKSKAEKAIEKVKACKMKAEADDATDEDLKAYEKAKAEADEAMDYATKLESDEDMSAKVEAKKEEKFSSAPKLKTMEQLTSEYKLAATPPQRAAAKQATVNDYSGKTFSQLQSSNEGKKLLANVLTRDGHKDVNEYRAVLSSIMTDPKYAAVVEKLRLHTNVSQSALEATRITNPNSRTGGMQLSSLMGELNGGYVNVLGKDNRMKQVTNLSSEYLNLTSTDAALASPALNTIEWLSIFLFKLFPNNSWKNDIQIFSASVTGANTGVIWPNIAADPTIYKGAKPSTSAYTYTDTAVSLALIPYWLQPMEWQPQYMHQLRYDQMGTGWAQGLNKLGAIIDDNLIYTLAANVPASSIIKSTGLSGYSSTPITIPFDAQHTYNSFYYNPSFSGSLLAPVLNDIVSVEQLYNQQNFDLSSEQPVIVTDPIMDSSLAKDPETKSLLTRWVNSQGEDFEKFKHTILPQRSRVAIYDQATGQVKDPNGSIPSTSVSASLAFLPSQVGIAMGLLDVFFVQDVLNYGLMMSADVRMGANQLRANFDGTALLTYGMPNV
jgi:hypothetical protein